MITSLRSVKIHNILVITSWSKISRKLIRSNWLVYIYDSWFTFTFQINNIVIYIKLIIN